MAINGWNRMAISMRVVLEEYEATMKKDDATR
jgi:hypothetical protein